jgi:hypothetical protein
MIDEQKDVPAESQTSRQGGFATWLSLSVVGRLKTCPKTCDGRIQQVRPTIQNQALKKYVLSRRAVRLQFHSQGDSLMGTACTCSGRKPACVRCC